MSDAIAEVVTVALSGTGAMAVVAFLVKSLLSHWLDKSVTSFRDDLSRSSQKEVELHRKLLQAQHDSELALLQAQLRRSSFAREAVVVRLQERQLDIVSELYGKLVEGKQALESLVRPMQWAGEPEEDVKRKAAHAALTSFSNTYESKKIFLSRRVCGAVDQVLKATDEAWFEFTTTRDIWEQSRANESRVKALEARLSAWNTVQRDLPPLIELVEAEFRHLVGVVEQEHLEGLPRVEEQGGVGADSS